MEYKKDLILTNILLNILKYSPANHTQFYESTDYYYYKNLKKFIKKYRDNLKDPEFLQLLKKAFVKINTKLTLTRFLLTVLSYIPDSYKPLIAEFLKDDIKENEIKEFLVEVKDKEIWIICGEIFEYADDILLAKYIEAKKRIKELEAEILHLKYMPGGPEYAKAKDEFENLVKH